jgi:nucleoid DNA-binding protein
MSRKIIAELLREHFGADLVQANQVTNLVIDALIAALLREGHLTLARFGGFKIVQEPALERRTKTKIYELPARNDLRFMISPHLDILINPSPLPTIVRDVPIEEQRAVSHAKYLASKKATAATKAAKANAPVLKPATFDDEIEPPRKGDAERKYKTYFEPKVRQPPRRQRRKPKQT